MSYANVNRDSALVFINNVYSELVKILREAADNNVPAKAKKFLQVLVVSRIRCIEGELYS